MTQYHVDSAEVAQASALAARSAQAIRSEVSGMLAHLRALEGSWQGGAALAFADIVQQWHATQLQVESALDEITVALGQAAQSYESAEETASRMFAR